MGSKNSIARYRRLYAQLLRFYPKPYRERFAAGMAQTFNDLCREREQAGDGLFRLVLWMFAETSAGAMRENMTLIVTQRNMIRPATVTAFLLLIPLLGNLFVEGWNWPPAAFVVCGGLIFGAGFTWELIASRGSTDYQVATGMAIVAAFLLVWGNFVQSADDVNPAAFMYFVAPLVGIIGAALARFQPTGMSRALFATALVQAVVLVVALAIRNPEATPWSAAVARGFGGNALFLMMFVGSALLYRRAARERQKPELKPTARIAD